MVLPITSNYGTINYYQLCYYHLLPIMALSITTNQVRDRQLVLSITTNRYHQLLRRYYQLLPIKSATGSWRHAEAQSVSITTDYCPITIRALPNYYQLLSKCEPVADGSWLHAEAQTVDYNPFFFFITLKPGVE